MLKVIKSERVIMVDIDGTLVMHEFDKSIPNAVYVDILDPVYTDGTTIKLRVNEPMLRLVHEEIARGSQVCFWSRGGFEWATNVVTALDLHSYPKAETIVMTKPFAYFDDADVSSWMPDRVYIGPDVPYKK